MSLKCIQHRPVAKGGSLGAEELPSQIKGPQFYHKGQLFCLKNHKFV